MACGQQHTVVVDAEGGAYSWGLGSFGQLGHGGYSDERVPRLVQALASFYTRPAIAFDELKELLESASRLRPDWQSAMFLPAIARASIACT